MYGTCENTDCVSYMYPCPLPDDYGTVICGPCGNPVTNIEVNGPVEPKEMPTWEIG